MAHQPWGALNDQVLRVFSTDLSMADAVAGADLVHSHTWYANLAGRLASLRYGVPHVVTMHSLEPLRPWKAEQLGGGYALSSWAERVGASRAAAVVAVSEGMRADVLSAYPEISPERARVIRNGIDTAEYAPDPEARTFSSGTASTLPAVRDLRGPDHQAEGRARAAAGGRRRWTRRRSSCSAPGAADTPELGAEVSTLVAELQASRSGVIWIPEMLPKPDVIQLLTHALLFACPSVYEPLGIVNLEAMACATAVVGVPGRRHPRGGRRRRDRAARPAGRPGVAGRRDEPLLRDPVRAAAMGRAGRERAVAEFCWDAVAAQTAALYAELTGAD